MERTLEISLKKKDNWVKKLSATLPYIAIILICTEQGYKARGSMIAQSIQKENPVILNLTSSAFEHNQPIPATYTCKGANISPPLSWGSTPEETKSFALICDDPDAMSVANKVWVHWVIFNIPASQRDLNEGIPTAPTLFSGAKQGGNDFGSIGYRGPCPPSGHGVHHYHFTLYALDTLISLEAEATREEVIAALQGHIIAQGLIIGTFSR